MSTSGRTRRSGGGAGAGAGGSGGANGFKGLGLSESVLRGVHRLGFKNPTPVQRKVLPVALSGVDTVAMARTGSGKTCAFLIPLMETLLQQMGGGDDSGAAATSNNSHYAGIRGLVLSPTRELSLQTLKVFSKLAADTILKAIGIHGGEGMEKQFALLASRPDVVVATPGRLAHHLEEIPDFNLSAVRICVLDEADRLLEMGFAAQIRQIHKTIPEACQKLLLSATLPRVLVDFTRSGFCGDPTMVRLDQEATVSAELRMAFLTCRSLDKDAALLHLLDAVIRRRDETRKKGGDGTTTGLTLIFAATRHHIEYLTTLLQAAGHDCTMIYGTLDTEARRANLAAFKSGQKPILVVTDVAARGIDVPLLDHVVHYHFPAAPKLFVHRSGRVARAGRIGYCWGLVEPDELPYMIDLHLFLGRAPCAVEGDATTYRLKDMTPDTVHYGSLPEAILMEEVENVQRLLHSELTGTQQAEALRALTKVCGNAMKQYRRTRAEASREAVRRAKAILEGERDEATGQRLGGGSIPPHPLLRRLLRERQVESGSGNTRGGDGDSRQCLGDIVERSRQREEFLRAVANFRPRETVFEAFATGGGKDVGVVSHIDRGRTTALKGKQDSSAALDAMRQMRREMRLARDKGGALMVAGSAVAEEANRRRQAGGAPTQSIEAGSSDETPTKATSTTLAAPMAPTPLPPPTKARLTKAERKRLRKTGTAAASGGGEARPTRATAKRGRDFRDPVYYISPHAGGGGGAFGTSAVGGNDDTEDAQQERARRMEAALQPRGLGGGGGLAPDDGTGRSARGRALRLEEAMLDIVGDENEALVRRHRLMRWDRAKRKYVATTVGEELRGDSRSKKRRLESGQLVRNDAAKLGQLYEQWQKKTNRSIGRSGVFDDAEDSAAAATAEVGRGRGRCGGGGARVDGREAGAGKRGPDKTKGSARDELKSLVDIKRERARKQNLKVKNMKRGDRRALEESQRQSKGAGRRPGAAGGSDGRKRR